jgi:hypothetical protein
MGSQVCASCPCGYKETFTVGGSMSSYRTQSYFPFYCTGCGLVSVNVAQDELRCPNNKRHVITRVENVSDTKRGEDSLAHTVNEGKQAVLEWLGIRKAKSTQLVSELAYLDAACQWGDHVIYDEPYRCPKCSAVTLHFASTGLRFS